MDAKYRFKTEKPLIEIPISVPTISFLTGNDGKQILDEYNGRVDQDFGGSNTLKALEYKNGVVQGSNPFAVALIGQIVRGSGLRAATPADIETSIRTGDILGIKEKCYIDTALVLRDDQNPNVYLARDLIAQLDCRQLEYPVMIPLAGVGIIRNDESPYGLAFTVHENAQVISAPVLNMGGRFNSEDMDRLIGLPNRVGDNGARRLYVVIKSGLSRLDVGGDLSLSADSDDLGGSSPVGRVAVVREGTEGAALFESQLRKEFEAQQVVLNQKFTEALNLLKGKQ